MQEVPKKRFDFGFGEAVCVREVLANFYTPHMGEHNTILSVRDMGYPGTGPGLPELIEDTRSVIRDETGYNYKHVLITAGAAQAIIVAVKALSLSDCTFVRYHEPYFSHYPSLIEMAGANPVPFADDAIEYRDEVRLVDSPSNPEGKTRLDDCDIWDATYANRIYSKLHAANPKHKIMIGSFGKLLGLNGVRLGWIATDDSYLFDKMVDINYHMTLGVSVPSQRLVSSIIENVEMGQFTQEAALQIDCNREEMSKLEYLSGDDEVPSSGMFYWASMDSKARGLLKIAGVKWIEGTDCGGTEYHLRLNLAQSRKLTQEMVRAVRKLDGKK